MSDGTVLLVNNAYDELDEFANYVKQVRSASRVSAVSSSTFCVVWCQMLTGQAYRDNMDRGVFLQGSYTCHMV